MKKPLRFTLIDLLTFLALFGVFLGFFVAIYSLEAGDPGDKFVPFFLALGGSWILTRMLIYLKQGESKTALRIFVIANAACAPIALFMTISIMSLAGSSNILGGLLFILIIWFFLFPLIGSIVSGITSLSDSRPLWASADFIVTTLLLFGYILCSMYAG